MPIAIVAITQDVVRTLLTAIPKYILEKFILKEALKDDEEIDLGRIRIITGTKYRQFCRARYGPNYIQILADNFLSNPAPAGGQLDFITGERAIQFYRSLIGLGEIGEDDLPPYEEPEGVTTIPLPPIAPVLFAFLIWRAGKQGLKLLESWRVNQVPTRPGESAEGSRKDVEHRGGLLDAMYDSMMTFVDSDPELASQEGESELSALELPFLVALPVPPTENLVQDNSSPVNPDSSRNHDSTMIPRQRRTLAFALGLSTPDSVGLQRVIWDSPCPDTTPTASCNSILVGEQDPAADEYYCDRTPRHSDIVFSNRGYEDDGAVHSHDLNSHSRKHRSAPDVLLFRPPESQNESSDGENQTRSSGLYSFGYDLDPDGGYSVPGEVPTTTSSVDLIARTALSDFTNGQEGVFILVLDGDSARDEYPKWPEGPDKRSSATSSRQPPRTPELKKYNDSTAHGSRRMSVSSGIPLPDSTVGTKSRTSKRPQASASAVMHGIGNSGAHKVRDSTLQPNQSNSRHPPSVTSDACLTSRDYFGYDGYIPPDLSCVSTATGGSSTKTVRSRRPHVLVVPAQASPSRYSLPTTAAVPPSRLRSGPHSADLQLMAQIPVQRSSSHSSQGTDSTVPRRFLVEREQTKTGSHHRRSSTHHGPPLTPLRGLRRSCQQQEPDVRRPDSPRPSRAGSKRAHSYHLAPEPGNPWSNAEAPRGNATGNEGRLPRVQRQASQPQASKSVPHRQTPFITKRSRSDQRTSHSTHVFSGHVSVGGEHTHPGHRGK